MQDDPLPPLRTPRELAAIERRRRRARLDVLLSRNAVVMALCRLSDPSGLFVAVGIGAIAAAAKLSVSTARKQLDEMALRGELVGFEAGPKNEQPFWLLLDAPGAAEDVERLIAFGYIPNRASRAAREKCGPTQRPQQPPLSPLF